MSRGIVIKASPDVDLYVEWSTIVESPTFVGTRGEILDHLMLTTWPSVADPPEVRLSRADATGTSAAGDYAWFGAWDDDGFIVEQRGMLPRARLRDFALLYAADDRGWLDLLEPFDGETAVRRD